MTPIYMIRMGGADITGNFNDRLETITVVMHDGNEADTVDIELDDRDSAIAVPPKGNTIEVFLGFKETGVTSLGTYIIQTVKLAYKPSTMSIHGKSADMSKSTLKAHRTQNYENMSVGDIVNQIAGRQGLSANVIGSFGSPYTMLHQTDESDMHLLNRIARDHDALFKIADGVLNFSPRGQYTNASGETVNVTLGPTDVKPGSVTVTHLDRSKFDGTQAYYYDSSTATRKVAGNAGGDGNFAVRHPMVDQDKANSAAAGRANELQRDKVNVRAEIAYGNAAITAGGSLTLAGFRDGIDGTYNLNQVEHNYDSAGYTTKLEADAGNGGDPDDGDEE